MAKEVILPKFGFTHESSQIVEWLKNPGDEVEKGEPLLEVTTDKVNMVVDAPETGILEGIRYFEGDEVQTTEIVAYILRPGETVPEHEPATAQAQEGTREGPVRQPASSATPVAERIAQREGIDLADVRGTGPGGRVTRADVEVLAQKEDQVETSRPRATPAARRIARERGVPLRDLAGSGPRGRIQAQDVASFQIPQDGKEEPLTKIRRTIAERMTRSFRDVPHFQVELDVDMTRLEALRTHLNEQAPPRISTTAVLVKATGWALSHHPKLRARYQDERIVISERIHIGVAVALEEGLIVPVIRDADQKGLAQIADELSSLSEKAQAGRLSSSDLSEGTFTISNLGMFRVDRFTAIINPPEAAILAVGRSRDRVVPDPTRGTGFAVRPMITLRLSCDHRVLDGAVAAQFLTDLGKAIEEPGWLAY